VPTYTAAIFSTKQFKHHQTATLFRTY